MLEVPEIVDVPDIRAAVIHLTVPSSEIMQHMGPGIQEVYKVLADQGITPTGPWFTHHFKIPDEQFDFEICVPVDADVAPQGRVRPGTLPAHRAARTVYRGGYEGLGTGWGEFLTWIEAQGLKTRPDLWEVYVVGPESGSDSSIYKTQLNQPLA